MAVLREVRELSRPGSYAVYLVRGVDSDSHSQLRAEALSGCGINDPIAEIRALQPNDERSDLLVIVTERYRR